jgi:hypothetical protein
MGGERLQIFLNRHACDMAELFRIALQQVDALMIEPFGAFDNSAQIFRMRQSIAALEVRVRKTRDNRSPIAIAKHFPFSHSHN